MAHIETNLSTGSDSFKANRDGMLALIERVRMLEERTRHARRLTGTRLCDEHEVSATPQRGDDLVEASVDRQRQHDAFSASACGT